MRVTIHHFVKIQNNINYVNCFTHDQLFCQRPEVQYKQSLNFWHQHKYVIDLLTMCRLHLEHFVWGQLLSCVCELAAFDRVLEEDQGLYYVTEQVRYFYALGQWGNSLHFAGPEWGVRSPPKQRFAISRDDDLCCGYWLFFVPSGMIYFVL